MAEQDERSQKLADLLLAWEMNRENGRSISLDELCAAHPDLLLELKERIKALEAVDSLLNGKSDMGLANATDSTVDLAPVTHLVDHELLPNKLGRYAIRSRLGRGGFGVVYLAHDPQLDRLVALKVPRRERFRTADQIASFIQEAKMAAKLKHPGLVSVYDVQEEAGLPFIVQEYIDGENLASWATRKQPSFEQIATIIVSITDALGYAHQQGLTHCDLKLANVLMDIQNVPHVADFGLAVHESVRSALKGSRFGTPSVMAPEQVRGEGHRLDGRTDIWAIGVMLYELLVKQKPFNADCMDELFNEIETLDPRPPRQINPGVPRELERICLRCLEKRRPERYNSSNDLGEDLQAWLSKLALAETPQPSTTASTNQTTTIVEPESSSTVQSKIIPKGLRSFDVEDADFFLDLLPGPRDRAGLPGSIRFWKNRIEEKDPDNTFEVGLIYGPSGCGKTSFVKAGLLPKLSESILPVYVEASAEDTEKRILKQLRKHFTSLAATVSLPQACAELRKTGVERHRKLLIVIDQFEQWLHVHAELKQSQLVDTLRQCDGARIQAILFVRDDFFASVHRLFQELEHPLLEGHNYALVDRFDKLHARKVLIALGHAYDKFGDKLTPAQEQFVVKAVNQLTEEEKVVSIRLALFVDMIKSRPWTLSTLEEIGGVSGVGVTFLRETFTAKTANPSHRIHEKAIRNVLNALLPETDIGLKGAMQSVAFLREESGYRNDPNYFAEVLRILDQDFRIISPTDLDENVLPNQSEVLESSPSSNPPRHYQLTHDFLVPSIREWLDDLDRQSAVGRAKIRLKALARSYTSTRDNRFLPTTLEFVSIFRHVRRGDCDQAMMTVYKKTLSRITGQLLLAAVCICILVGYATYKHSQYQRQLADEWVNTWTSAQNSALPVALNTLQLNKREVVMSLQRKLAKNDNTASELLRLKLGIVLLQGLSPSFVRDIANSIGDATYDELPIFRLAFSRNSPDSLEILRQALHSATNDETETKIAVVLFHLGDPSALDDCLSDAHDTLRQATAEYVINEDLDTVSPYLAHLATSKTKDHDRLAVMVNGLGGKKWYSMDSSVRATWIDQLNKLYRGSPSGPMHSASEYALRKLDALPDLKLPNETDLGHSEFNWFRARNGLTFIRIPAAGKTTAREVRVFDKDFNKIHLDIGTAKDFWISSTEVPGRLFGEYAQRSEFKQRWERSWPLQEMDLPAVKMRIAEAMDFCNWLSQKEGLTPCYSEIPEDLPVSPEIEQALTSPALRKEYEILNNWRVNPEGSGYRIPNYFELIYTACGAGKEVFSAQSVAASRTYISNHCWFVENTAATQNSLQICGRLIPNSLGLFDTLGNACELGIDNRSPQINAQQLSLPIGTKSSLQDVLSPDALPIYLWNSTPDQGFRLIVESAPN